MGESGNVVAEQALQIRPGQLLLLDRSEVGAPGDLPPTLATREELLWRTGDLFAWILDGTLDVRIDKTWPLAEAAEAHRYLEARQTKGKVMLIP